MSYKKASFKVTIMRLLNFYVLFFTAAIGVAQTFSAKVLDAKTQKPIPYATIQFAENNGVITNEEGRFSFTLTESAQMLDSLYISSMGYERKGFVFETVAQDSVLYVNSKAIALSGVYLFDKELDVDEIIQNMVDRLSQNTNRDPVKQRYFLRQSIFGNIQKVDLGFEKSSIEELGREFIDSITRVIPRRSSHYTETLGELYQTKDAKKVTILKAAELYDKKNIGSFEDLGKRMETMFKQNVKPDSYLKIKSGLFSQKIQVDSILTDIEAEEARAVEKELQRDSITGLVDGQKFIFDELLQEVFYEKDTKLNVVNKKRKYKFTLAGYTDIADEGVYVIDFTPKGKAAFKGRLFINITDFGVMRIDFENLKNIKNFRLLGIFYRETLYKGSMHFAKLSNGKYDLRFADFNFGRWFRFDRPLDVIEKNKNVKGRRKQNELRLNIDFRMTNTNKWELIVFDQELISQSQFDAVVEDKSARSTYMAQYNPEFWQGYNIMEPNQAIKEFTTNGE